MALRVPNGNSGSSKAASTKAVILVSPLILEENYS